MRVHEDEGHLRRTLQKIRDRIAAGDRAPFTDEIRSGFPTLEAMVRRGWIRMEVYARNWRVIEDKLEGGRTKEPPFSNTGPYLVMDSIYPDCRHRPNE